MRINARVTAIALAAVALTGTGITVANAGPTGPFPPVTCEFESTWDKTTCTIDGNTFPWNISRAQEAADKELEAARARTLARCVDQYRHTPAVKVIVRKGDTLWSLSVRYLHDGHAYPTIKAQNHLKSNTIRVGQTLTIKKFPSGCPSYLFG